MGDIKCGQVRKIIVLWTSINLIEVRRVQMRVNSEEWRYQEKSGPSNKDLETRFVFKNAGHEKSKKRG